MYNARDDWDGDDSYHNPEPHYRLYIEPHVNAFVVICVQGFDYPDYDARRILSRKAWATEGEAQQALIDLLPHIVDHEVQRSYVPFDMDERARIMARALRAHT